MAALSIQPPLAGVTDYDQAVLRQRMERAVERLIAALDALDGDPDLEEQCEDEGAQCEGEGSPEYEGAVTYAPDGHGGCNQSLIAGIQSGLAVSQWGC